LHFLQMNFASSIAIKFIFLQAVLLILLYVLSANSRIYHFVYIFNQ
jgi:hypothetical protein